MAATTLRSDVRSWKLWALLATGLVAVVWQQRAWPRPYLFDLYQRVHPSHHPDSDITIVDIDGESVRRVGRWPWPRDRLAAIVDAARGARAIGLDILLLDPDTAAADSEARLATAMGGAPVVLAATRDPAIARQTISITPIIEAGPPAQGVLPSVSHVAWPLPLFERHARGTGLALLLPERDGVVRRLPTVFADGPSLLPSFALEVLRVAEGAAQLGLQSSAQGVRAVSVGRFAPATDANGALWPYFSRAVPARTVPAYEVLAGTVDPALLDGRIVLVGSSLAGLGDVHLTPLGVIETGTAINAQLIASVLARDTLWRPAVAEAGEVLATIMLAVGSLLSFGRVPWRLQAGLIAAAVLVLAAASITAFCAAHMLLDWTLPASVVVAVNLGLLAIGGRNERRGRHQAEARLTAALGEIDQARAVVAQALHGSKLATLGEMAAVLAHELRQPIATMSMAAENAEAALQDGSLDVGDARLRIDRILTQAKRAESMIDQLGIFARAESGQAVPIDIGEAVRDALLLVEPTLRRSGIAPELRCPPGLPRVRAAKVLIEQVVVNLCINARDALADTAPEARAITVSLAAAGAFVRLEIADTGPGMAAAVMDKLFDPFFTTKAAGSGTGLGLPICRRIVESFGGTISARNGPVGAVFLVSLPAISQESGRSGSRSGARS